MRKPRTGLYGEGLRLLRAPGSAFVVLSAVVGSLCVVFRDKQFWLLSLVLGMAVTVVFAALLAVRAFRFVHDRRAADWYHSLPCRRDTLYVTLLGATLTWLLMGIVVLWGCLYVGSDVVTAPLWCQPWRWCVMLTGAAVYTVGIVLLAMSLTGTLSSQLLVALVVCVGPTMLRKVILSVVQNSLTLLPISEGVYQHLARLHPYAIGSTLWDYGFGDLPSSLVVSDYTPHLSVLRHDYSVWRFANGEALCKGIVESSLYALLFGVVCLAAAWLLFRRRPSEAAGHAVVYPVVQTVFRSLAALLVCSMAVPDTVELLTQPAVLGDSGWLWVALIYLLALVVYFGYELITTRRVRTLWRTLPAAAVVVLINVAAVGGLTAAQQYLLYQRFTPDTVTGITFTSLSNSTKSANRFGFRAEGYTTHDATLIREVLDQFTNTQLALRGEQPDYMYDAGARNDIVEIHTNRGTYSRRLSLKKRLREIQNDPDFQQRCLVLPAWDEEGVTVTVEGLPVGLDTDGVRDLYETLRGEIGRLSFEQYERYVEQVEWAQTNPYQVARSVTSQMTDSQALVGTLSGSVDAVSGRGGFVIQDGSGYAQIVPISTLTPATFTQWARAVNRAATWLDNAALRKDIVLLTYAHAMPTRKNIAVKSMFFNEPEERETMNTWLDAAVTQRATLTADLPIVGVTAKVGEQWYYAYFNAEWVDGELRILSAS